MYMEPRAPTPTYCLKFLCKLQYKQFKEAKALRF